MKWSQISRKSLCRHPAIITEAEICRGLALPYNLKMVLDPSS